MPLLVFETISSVRSWVEGQKNLGLTIGFVPTMGALHAGHMSLVDMAREKCDVIITSIFVNPTQFTNANDLKHYPITLENDKSLLEQFQCDAVFIPSVVEMYPQMNKGHWDFGVMSKTLEGHFRPGHFDGVLTIVKKFFEIIQPDYAFFGEKDFQQLAHIRELVRVEKLPLKIVGCATSRDSDGLAMSSRNIRLSAVDRKNALAISRTLMEMKKANRSLTPVELKNFGEQKLRNSSGIEFEYLEIIDGNTFESLQKWEDSTIPVAVVAVYVGDVRLIDNIHL